MKRFFNSEDREHKRIRSLVDKLDAHAPSTDLPLPDELDQFSEDATGLSEYPTAASLPMESERYGRLNQPVPELYRPERFTEDSTLFKL
jgi:hypothetical protein